LQKFWGAATKIYFIFDLILSNVPEYYLKNSSRHKTIFIVLLWYFFIRSDQIRTGVHLKNIRTKCKIYVFELHIKLPAIWFTLFYHKIVIWCIFVSHHKWVWSTQ